jgi:hypothetical protein
MWGKYGELSGALIGIQAGEMRNRAKRNIEHLSSGLSVSDISRLKFLEFNLAAFREQLIRRHLKYRRVHYFSVKYRLDDIKFHVEARTGGFTFDRRVLRLRPLHLSGPRREHSKRKTDRL